MWSISCVKTNWKQLRKGDSSGQNKQHFWTQNSFTFVHIYAEKWDQQLHTFQDCLPRWSVLLKALQTCCFEKERERVRNFLKCWDTNRHNVIHLATSQKDSKICSKAVVYCIKAILYVYGKQAWTNPRKFMQYGDQNVISSWVNVMRIMYISINITQTQSQLTK